MYFTQAIAFGATITILSIHLRISNEAGQFRALGRRCSGNTACRRLVIYKSRRVSKVQPGREVRRHSGAQQTKQRD